MKTDELQKAGINDARNRKAFELANEQLSAAVLLLNERGMPTGPEMVASVAKIIAINFHAYAVKP